MVPAGNDFRLCKGTTRLRNAGSRPRTGHRLIGIAIAGSGPFRQVVLLLFVGLSRKHTDEARTLEKPQELHRAA